MAALHCGCLLLIGKIPLNRHLLSGPGSRDFPGSSEPKRQGKPARILVVSLVKIFIFLQRYSNIRKYQRFFPPPTLPFPAPDLISQLIGSEREVWFFYCTMDVKHGMQSDPSCNHMDILKNIKIAFSSFFRIFVKIWLYHYV